MKKIVVTGGAGFIGREVVKQLLKKKYSVRVVDNLSNPASKIETGYEFIRADLADIQQATKAFSGMDICIHLAAKIGGVGYFNANPATILSENNKIYSATFEAAVKNKIKRFVYISSSMVFESATTFPSHEDSIRSIPIPVSSYGFSKLIGEKYCYAFWDQYRLPFSICRPFNAYGKNEDSSNEVGRAHVIPDLTKKILDGQDPLELLGDGQQIRSFTEVRDIASGIIAVMEHKNGINQDFNIANPQPIKMFELAQIIWEILNPNKQFRVSYTKGFKHDVKIRIPDTQKIETMIGWKSNISLKKGLKETVLWMKETYGRAKK